MVNISAQESWLCRPWVAAFFLASSPGEFYFYFYYNAVVK